MKENEKKLQSVSEIFKISAVVSNPEYFKLLAGNKTVNPRSVLFEELNAVFYPPLSANAWKLRFLYPEKKIPKKHRDIFIPIMESALLRALQELKKENTLQINDLKLFNSKIDEALNIANLDKKIIEIPENIYHD